ncbi:acyl-CoA synthetase [Microbispora sp. NEAU-D428]|uniref:acyl-CoA synthetase n=1 Tax=Microbispora sitophila TaxID=2771537 RepID=UPI0018674A05|nr:acyl-CoA synthetase [Microbispora sitophila]MBE3011770.1 acyl-CoA synthetase [Microbispora sitophila]
MTLNVASLFEAVAAAVPERLALVCDARRLSFAELDVRANALANHLLAAGVRPDEHVGVHMLNGVEFVEALLACLKIRAVPINVNYRYTDRELHYVYEDAGLVALVVGGEFAASAAALADRCPTLRHVVVVDEGTDAPCWPDRISVADYEKAVAAQPATAPMAGERTADDHYVLYTGGTTGMPKGVVWRHEDFYFAALKGGNHYGPPYRTAEELAAAAAAATPLSYLLTAPLMHGAAAYTLFGSLLAGSVTILMRRFDPVETLRLIEREHAMIVTVVGDAIARPLVDAIREHGADHDLSSMKVLGSGGALLSRSVREEAAALIPGLYVNDGFGSSESGVDGTLGIGPDGRMRLAAGPRIRVVDENFRQVEPGSGRLGYVARTGNVPLRYHNDPDKSAKTFPVVDGARWAVLGDMARVEEDGTIVLLGRGSGCINTGGEKVFPEEVEQAMKSHPAVMDALVAGVPDERFGERVAAVVELRPGATAGVEELRAHCRTQIAGYKVPASIVVVDVVERSPSGKADYRWAKSVLSTSTGLSTQTRRNDG